MKLLLDIAAISGCGLVCYGLWTLAPWSAYVFGGGVLFASAWYINQGRSNAS